MTLPAFAFERRRRQHGARSYAADASAQQQTHWPRMLLSIDETDGRTDGWAPDRYISPYAGGQRQ